MSKINKNQKLIKKYTFVNDVIVYLLNTNITFIYFFINYINGFIKNSFTANRIIASNYPH
jgi:hypothetical protein